MISLQDDRFRKHPSFGMYVANQVLRKTALEVGNIVALKTCHGMTVEELAERVQNNDQSVLRALQYYSKTMEGSPQYFYYKHCEAHSFSEV